MGCPRTHAPDVASSGRKSLTSLAPHLCKRLEYPCPLRMIGPHPRDSALTNMGNNPQPTNRPISAHKKTGPGCGGRGKRGIPGPRFSLILQPVVFLSTKNLPQSSIFFCRHFLVLRAHLSSDQEYLLQPRPTNWLPRPYVCISMGPNAKCPLGGRVL
jgi:hypothetical protein